MRRSRGPQRHGGGRPSRPLSVRGFLGQPSAERDPPYREWIAAHPCVVEGCEGIAACCHFRNRRMWGDVGNCFPACHHHHLGEQHAHGIKTFQAQSHLDLELICAGYGEAWAQHKAAAPDLPF